MKILKQLFYKKYNHSLTITSKSGLHLRPIAKFVNISKKYKCDVILSFNGINKNAKSVNSILELGANYQDNITLITQGQDAKEALKTLAQEFDKIMQDDIASYTKQKEQQTKMSHSYSDPSENIKSIYSGIAIAPVYNYISKTNIIHTDISLQDAIKRLSQKLSTSTNDIFVAQKALIDEIPNEIEDLKELKLYIQNKISSLPSSMSAKAIDYQDILHKISDTLGVKEKLILPTKESILICDDLLPSQIQEIKNSKIVGVILTKASVSSHSAILLRSEGIVSAICHTNIKDGITVLLDTTTNTLIQNPSTTSLQQASTIIKQISDKKQKEESCKHQKAITKGGKEIKVLANIQDVNSALQAKTSGADGIGLLRSEFIFTHDNPTLQQQIDVYTKIFDIFDEVTIRTLDVGGDKNLPYIQIPKEDNPFLGIRGIRLLDIVPQIISTQLLAIYKASNHKPVKIMFPMISTLQEFTKAKEFAQKIAKENDMDISHIKFGMMIEVPLVLFNLQEFDKLVDFYSIGSNDLAQYSFAIQRGHPSLEYNENSDEFLNLIAHIVSHTTKPLSICGEIASNPKAIKKLIQFGIDTISVSPANIAQIKEEIRDV